jgi:hypothetical protein
MARFWQWFFAVTMIGACASRTNSKCFGGGGSEVWVERHLVGRATASGVATLSVQMVADSAGPPAAGWQTTIAVSSDSQATQYAGVGDSGKAVFNLRPGRYVIKLTELMFVSLTRSVSIASSEQVSIEVQRPRLPLCVGPTVRTGS